MSDINTSPPELQNAERIACLERDMKDLERTLRNLGRTCHEQDSALYEGFQRLRARFEARFGPEPRTCKKCNRALTSITDKCGICGENNPKQES